METQTASLVGTGRDRPRPLAAILRVVYPRDLHWSHQFNDASITLGRQPEGGCPALSHATVSRRHAQVWWDSRGHHAVRDAGSRHGTRIGTTPIGDRARMLSDGDLIRLGDVLIVYEVASDPASDNHPTAVDHSQLPGAAPAMSQLRMRVAQAATDHSPALLIGDTGTGKEWVARELHRISGRPGPLVAVNCATLTPQLVESQLFGHARGAFTGATTEHDGFFRQANAGTLFLDEIGELPLDLQPKLLRVIQDGIVQPLGATRPIAVDLRICAATNRDLFADVECGRFRRDLYARLSKWQLQVPNLAARRGDILAWVDRLWQVWHVDRARGSGPLMLTPGAAAAIVDHSWLDNLRGIDRLVHELGARGKLAVDLDDLPSWLDAKQVVVAADPSQPPSSDDPAPPEALTARPQVPSRDEFIKVWSELGGSVRAVAKHFARDRRQIYRWLSTHGLRAPTGDHEE